MPYRTAITALRSVAASSHNSSYAPVRLGREALCCQHATTFRDDPHEGSGLGVTFVYNARHQAERQRRTQPQVNTRSVFTEDGLDDEARAMLEQLEADVRSGKLEQNGVQCPVCENRMAVVDVDDLAVNVCSSCLASWFDQGELAELLHLVRDVPGEDYRSRDSRFACPRCEETMREYSFVNPYNLLVDCCQNCGGVLLENGELERAAKLSAQA